MKQGSQYLNSESLAPGQVNYICFFKVIYEKTMLENCEGTNGEAEAQGS